MIDEINIYDEIFSIFYGQDDDLKIIVKYEINSTITRYLSGESLIEEAWDI